VAASPLLEFWLAIHDLWDRQRALGLAVAKHEPQWVIDRLDSQMALAMKRVERVDDQIMASGR